LLCHCALCTRGALLAYIFAGLHILHGCKPDYIAVAVEISSETFFTMLQVADFSS